jgi:hypothetical protein
VTFLLCNSAVVAQNNDGTYTYTTITLDQAIDWLQAHSNEFQSRIGYPETADYISRISGLRIALCRDPSWLEVGDESLVVRPEYRIQDPKAKRDWAPADEDYCFGIMRRIA